MRQVREQVMVQVRVLVIKPEVEQVRRLISDQIRANR